MTNYSLYICKFYANYEGFLVKISDTLCLCVFFAVFMDQELISYRYSSCSSSCWGDRLQKT